MNSILRIKSLKLNKNLFKMRVNNFADIFKDKEKVEEKIFIDKHERDLMKKLLSKLENKGEIDQHHHEYNPDADDLSHILERHSKKITNELFSDLLRWKKGEL